jgi:hypothetical protein
MVKLIYVHINSNEDALPPDTLYKSIHQVCVVSESIHILILTNRHFIKVVHENINILEKKNLHKITIVPIELIWKSDNVQKKTFRDDFWRYTTERFLVIDAYLREFEDTEPFIHIENDVMIYTDISEMENIIKESKKKVDVESRIIKDSDNRGIGSLIYSNKNEWNLFIEYVKNGQGEKNDMYLLGGYELFNTLPIDPKESRGTGIWDGACIGQYIGGIDTRNLSENDNTSLLKMYDNPSIGFINETSVFKPDTIDIIKKQVEDDKDILKKYYVVKDGFVNIHNIHVHSKHLAPFSSVFDIEYNQIISGDRIVSLVDIVLCTNDIYNYHKHLSNYNKNVVIIKDFRRVNDTILKSIISDISKKRIKIFLYTHILSQFIEYILPIFETLDNTFIYYIHNSDDSFEDEHKKLLDSSTTYRVYSQNINTSIKDNNNKLRLLPIGIANAMFDHGNMIILYKTMCDMYTRKKEKNIFTSITGRVTHDSRVSLIKVLEENPEYNMSMYKSLEYSEYTREMGKHYFVLCPRGNGIDTHRFWEALYMGAIPVLIQTEETCITNFINYILELRIPCYIVKSLSFFEMNGPSFFNKDLYDRIRNKSTTQNLQCLKLRNYI